MRKVLSTCAQRWHPLWLLQMDRSQRHLPLHGFVLGLVLLLPVFLCLMAFLDSWTYARRAVIDLGCLLSGGIAVVPVVFLRVRHAFHRSSQFRTYILLAMCSRCSGSRRVLHAVDDSSISSICKYCMHD